MHREDPLLEIAALGYCKFLLRKQEASVLLHRDTEKHREGGREGFLLLFDFLDPTHVRSQRLRNDHRSIFLLIVLQNRNPRSTDR